MSKYISKQPDGSGFINFSDQEHDIWTKLIKRQMEIIDGRACPEFIKGLNLLNLDQQHIPSLQAINTILNQHTGWQVEPVAAVIPPETFFTLLANKKFPVATFIRRLEHLDYIQEPDIFHEIFGHCPLLTQPNYADFIHAYGKIALNQDKATRRFLFRLFWFTIEFGLILTPQGLRIYGGGILSSYSETQKCLNGDNIHQAFSILNALRTPYRIDIEQPIYYIIEDMDSLNSLLDPSVLQDVEKAKALGDFTPHQKLNQQSGGIHGKFAC